MILDATAGNRTMWTYKYSDNIIYIDVETQLERKATIFCSNEQTPFPDKLFDTIFYDPPHTWGNKTDFHSYPRKTLEYIEKWHDNAIPRYYGWDRYDTREELVRHLYRANEEFLRILKDDGLLWLKWNEMSIARTNVLNVFSQWIVLLRLYVKAPSQTRGKHQTFWLALQKNKQDYRQLVL